METEETETLRASEMTEVSQHEQFEAAFLSVILMFVSVMKSSVTWDGLGSRSEELNTYIYMM